MRGQKQIIRNKTQTLVTNTKSKRIIESYLVDVMYASTLRPMFSFFPYETDREKKKVFPREDRRRELSKELLNLYERLSFTLKAKLTYVTNLTVTVTSAQGD